MDWLELLTETTQHIKATVTPLIKTSDAQKTYGIGAGGDPKKHIDLQAEKALIETFEEHSVDFILISEESGNKYYGTNPTNYVTVDPIDGTTNILRGIPFACTSIAISKAPRLDAVEAAIVTDLFHDITYLAQKNLGAYRNYQKIAPSQTNNLTEVVIGIDLNTYKVAELSAKLNQLLTQTKHVRHLGANALELCYVADGTTDVFIDVRGKLRTTDIAAAALIIKEAGATITTLQNTPLTSPLSPTETVAFIATGNSMLHQTILKTLKKA
ncbi:MAG: inositol monophosphatase family protein [Candidatus Bathyarchaeia archaeon]